MPHDGIYHAAVMFGDRADRAIRLWVRAKTPILCALCFAAGALVAAKMRE